MKFSISIIALITAAVFTLATGCSPQSTVKKEQPDSKVKVSNPAPPATVAAPRSTQSVDALNDDAHGHKEGSHGGIMVSLGRDSYHVEAVFDSDGMLRLYTLGQDESRIIDIESQELKGFIKSEGDDQAQSMVFKPAPQDGDVTGKTSLFVGEIPESLRGKPLDVTVPNIVIAGERFRLGFQSKAAQHGDAMPERIADQGAERELYLTAGGIYTQADIEANGSVTATQKFKGVKSAHDMFPKTGDKICPITQTKANKNFTWIVGGKAYEFCCPPCVDEFVKMAKTTPDKIDAPETYIK